MNSKISTPLRAALEEYRKADWSRLHMPGHKGAALEPFGNLMEYDVTEVEGTDSLFEDDGPLKELEEMFAPREPDPQVELMKRLIAEAARISMQTVWPEVEKQGGA